MVCYRAEEKGLKSANGLAERFEGTLQLSDHVLATPLTKRPIYALKGTLKSILTPIWL